MTREEMIEAVCRSMEGESLDPEHFYGRHDIEEDDLDVNDVVEAMSKRGWERCEECGVWTPLDDLTELPQSDPTTFGTCSTCIG